MSAGLKFGGEYLKLKKCRGVKCNEVEQKDPTEDIEACLFFKRGIYRQNSFVPPET